MEYGSTSYIFGNWFLMWGVAAHSSETIFSVDFSDFLKMGNGTSDFGVCQLKSIEKKVIQL